MLSTIDPPPSETAMMQSGPGASARDTEFAAWMQARQRKLLRTAYLLTGNVHEAEDLVQTALAKVYLAWDRVSKAQSIDAYARKILINEHTSMWRRLWRQRETVSDTSTYDIPIDSPDYDGVAAALWDSVRSLPERQRAVVVLRYYEQLSEKEAAEALGVTVGTIKSQSSRALDTLRTSLGDQFGPSAGINGWEAS